MTARGAGGLEKNRRRRTRRTERVADGRLVGRLDGRPREIARELAARVQGPDDMVAWAGVATCPSCQQPAWRMIRVDGTAAILVESCGCGQSKWQPVLRRAGCRTGQGS